MKSFKRYITEGKGGAEAGKMELIKTDEKKAYLTIIARLSSLANSCSNLSRRILSGLSAAMKTRPSVSSFRLGMPAKTAKAQMSVNTATRMRLFTTKSASRSMNPFRLSMIVSCLDCFRDDLRIGCRR